VLFAAFAITGDALSRSLIYVQRGRFSSRVVMRSLRTRHCVLCPSVVVLDFDVVEGGFEGR